MFIIVAPAGAKDVKKSEERIIEGRTYRVLLEGYIRLTKRESLSAEEFVRELLENLKIPQYIGDFKGEYKYFLTLKHLEKQDYLGISC